MDINNRVYLSNALENIEKVEIRKSLGNEPLIYEGIISELGKFKNILENKKLKTEFDLAYFKFVDNYILIGNLAIKLLNGSNYYNLSKHVLKNAIELNINDLSRIIKKLMSKNEYQWNFNKAKLLLVDYNLENKLSKEELEIILALIIFPSKIWKLGKNRYVKFKDWNELTYMHKLNRIIKYNELQQQFIEDYINYVSNYV